MASFPYTIKELEEQTSLAVLWQANPRSSCLSVIELQTKWRMIPANEMGSGL
jgi:hypothetical protein